MSNEIKTTNAPVFVDHSFYGQFAHHPQNTAPCAVSEAARHSSVAKKFSHMALSWASPTEPIDGRLNQPGPPMTLGNMRELGVHHLIGHCHNDFTRREQRPPCAPQTKWTVGMKSKKRDVGV